MADGDNSESRGAIRRLAEVVRRNIAATSHFRARDERGKTVADRFADGVTRLAGNLWWVAGQP